MNHSPVLTPFIDRYGKPEGGAWLAGKGASSDLLAVARCACDAGWFRVGGWEVAVGSEGDARKQLEVAGAKETSERYAHAAMIGNDAGALTAVVLWNDDQPECVYVLDPRFSRRRRRGRWPSGSAGLPAARRATTKTARRWASGRNPSVERPRLCRAPSCPNRRSPTR